MLSDIRYNFIMDELKRNKMVRTSTLAKTLDVSAETIRKDLEHLDSAGMLSKVHGGAITISGSFPEAPNYVSYVYESFDKRMSMNTDKKRYIAQKAIEYIHDGQNIALDSGTSSYEVAKLLKNRFHRLTILTNSVYVALELVNQPNYTVILTGGVLASDEYSLTSDFATAFIDKIHIDVMFLTSCGVSAEHGVTDQRLDEVKIHKKMSENSAFTIVLADESKLGKISLVSVCPLSEIDLIITNASSDIQIMNQIRAKGCDIITADATDSLK